VNISCESVGKFKSNLNNIDYKTEVVTECAVEVNVGKRSGKLPR